MSLWTWSPTNSSLGRPLHLTEERADPKTDEREGAAPRLVKSMAPNAFVRLACGGGHALALTPEADATPLPRALAARAGERVALALGSEGPGLSPGMLHAADACVTIPMASGVDSLNVAAAAAVACWLLAQPMPAE